MKKIKSHTRNQRRMYRIHKQEEKIHDLELLAGSLQQENQKYKAVIDKVIEEIAIIIRDCEESNEEDDLGLSLNDLNYILDILKEVR